MAAPEDFAVLALVKKAMSLEVAGHFARRSEYVRRALSAAEARGVQDCLVVATLQYSVASEIYDDAHHMHKADPTIRLPVEPILSLTMAAAATMQRRRAAGTLLAGCCRTDEVLYAKHVSAYSAMLCDQQAIGTDSTTRVAHDRCASLASNFGYMTFLQVASLACVIVSTTSTTLEERHKCLCIITLIADAIELMMQPRNENFAISVEGVLVMRVQSRMEVDSELKSPV